jgi:hypothetical protein
MLMLTWGGGPLGLTEGRVNHPLSATLSRCLKTMAVCEGCKSSAFLRATGSKACTQEVFRRLQTVFPKPASFLNRLPVSSASSSKLASGLGRNWG